MVYERRSRLLMPFDFSVFTATEKCIRHEQRKTVSGRGDSPLQGGGFDFSRFALPTAETKNAQAETSLSKGPPSICGSDVDSDDDLTGTTDEQWSSAIYDARIRPRPELTEKEQDLAKTTSVRRSRDRQLSTAVEAEALQSEETIEDENLRPVLSVARLVDSIVHSLSMCV